MSIDLELSASLHTMRSTRDQLRDHLIATSPEFRAYYAMDEAIHHLERMARAPVPNARTPAPDTSKTRPVTQAEAAIKALEEAGRPLGTQELMDRAHDHGALVGGKNPLVNFRSTLSHDPRFQSVKMDGQRVWWLTGRPSPNLGDAAQEPDAAADQRQAASGMFG